MSNYYLSVEERLFWGGEGTEALNLGFMLAKWAL
jgi:hypothetical protein